MVSAVAVPSVVLASMVSVKASVLDPGVMVSPVSWAGVSVQLPPPLLWPAERLASPGTPVMVIDSEASGSTVVSSTSDALMLSAIGVSSLPAAAATVRFGASATGVTLTSSVLMVSAVAVPSVVLASMVSVKASVLDPGVMVSPVSWAGVSVQLPPPLLWPAERLASPGTPVMVIDSEASGSTVVSSTSDALMLSAIGVSSLPAAAATVRFGASATGAIVMEVDATAGVGKVLAPSVDVTDTVNVSEPSVLGV